MPACLRVPPRAPDRATLLMFLAVVVILGVNFVAVRISNEGLDPLWGAGVRFAVAALLLAAITHLSRAPWPQGPARLGAVLYGVLAFTITYALLYVGLMHAPAAAAAVLFGLIPLFTVLQATLLGMEPLRARALAGAVTSFVGVAVIFGDALRADLAVLPLAAFVVAALAASQAGLVVKRFPGHPLGMNTIAMGTGSALLILAALAAGETPALPHDLRVWGALGWLVVASAVAFVLLVAVLSRWSASAVSYQAVLSPLVTVPVAAWLVAETPRPVFLVGAAVVLAGVYLASRAARGPPMEPQPLGEPPVPR